MEAWKQDGGQPAPSASTGVAHRGRVSLYNTRKATPVARVCAATGWQCYPRTEVCGLAVL